MFVVRSGGIGLVAEPIGLVQGRAVIELPVDRNPPYPPSAEAQQDWVRQVNTLAQRIFPKGSRIKAMDAGAEHATLRVTVDDLKDWEPGCGWAIPVELVAGALPAGRSWIAVSADRPRASLKTNRRAATADERTALQRAAEAQFIKQGMPMASSARVGHALAFARVGAGEALILVGDTFLELSDATAAPGTHRLFIVLEWRRGGWRTVYAHYDPTTESTEGYYSEEAIDLIDLDGDGQPKLVTWLVAHEVFDFAVYSKRAGAWRRIFLGGGGSC